MLRELSIKNYALIDDLEVRFTSGFTTITGETGAGKSILLGGLSLVLGKRADLSSLRDKERKCIIEAAFAIDAYNLRAFFVEQDLDYADVTLLRREILPSGKSRAFVNDTPVTLDVLSSLGGRLVDIHSQHQTLQLTESEFQMRVIDALAENGPLLREYRTDFERWKKAVRELDALEEFQRNANKEHDYHNFLWQELNEFPLGEGIQEELETEQRQLGNAETIMASLAQSHDLLQNEQMGILEQSSEINRLLQQLSTYGKDFETLHQRMESSLIELRDITQELEALKDGVTLDPKRLELVNEQLQKLYALQKKHQVATVTELLAVKEDLNQKVAAVENIEAQIEEKQAAVEKLLSKLEAKAQTLRSRRNGIIPRLKHLLSQNLEQLGMAAATFKIEIESATTFKQDGRDELSFLLAANKGSTYGPLKKVASGGELSRIMLTIKSILATYEQLPTMMFDEIDTGVSGEISNRMGGIMQQMGQHMQVFSITHLPQVASRGTTQFKVYKEEKEGSTHTRMKQLNEEERIVELAEMLGGKALSDSALAHAKQLLQVS